MSSALWPDVDDDPAIRYVPPEWRSPGFQSRRGKRGPDKQPRRHPGESEDQRQARVDPINIIRSSILKEDSLRERVPERLGDLLHVYFGFDYQEFHLELLKLMFKGGKWVVNWPTDHAKSTMTSYLFPILSLMNDPDASHIICGANENDSKSWVQMIQRALEGYDNRSAQLIRDYPWIARPALDVAQSWSTTQLTVAGRSVNKRNPSVLAIGAGSQDIRGRRGKLILDDIEGVKHQSSPSERDKLLKWVKQECIRCYEDRHESERPLLLACGTPFDVDSIYFRLEGGGVWKAHRRKVFTDPEPWRSTNPQDHIPPHTPANSMLWPDKYDKVMEQWRDLNADDFAIAYLMDPKRGDPSRLTLEEIEALTRSADAPEATSKIFVSLDPAGDSRTRSSDYAGLAVIKIQWPQDADLPLVEVLDAYAMRQGLFEQVHAAAELVRNHEGARLIYEIDGLGAAYRNAFEHLAPDVAQDMIRTRTRQYQFDKSMGITVVRTLVREARLLIPATKAESSGMKAFKAEVRDLGGRSHDHISAAVWFAVRFIYDQVRRSSPQPVASMGPRRFGNHSGALTWRNWRSG